MTETPNPNPEKTSALARLLMGDSTWCWNWKYNPGLYEHMHAMGVIAANYNDLEDNFYSLFFILLQDFQSTAPKYLFSKLSNAERLSTLSKLVERETNQEFKDKVASFMSGYGACAENRNILMHSSTHSTRARGEILSDLVLRKASKSDPDTNNFVSLKVSELRGIADDIANFSSFGIDLFLWRAAQFTKGLNYDHNGKARRPTLPETPAAPRKLLLSPQEEPQAETPPQQS